MPRYAISFDLDNKALKAAGYTQSQITNDLYGKEEKNALAACGFTEHPEGSVYHTGNLAGALIGGVNWCLFIFRGPSPCRATVSEAGKG